MASQVWRFGYGSNIGLETLKSKKNVNPSRYLASSIAGWELYFKPGPAYVDPAFAAVRPSSPDGEFKEVHGSAFLIDAGEAVSLDRQEGGYNVVPSRFVSYDGEVVEGVGLYVPKRGWDDKEDRRPSLRYLRLMRNGAREAGLRDDWKKHLDSVPHHVTPPGVRSKTERWIAEFHADPARRDELWTAERLSRHDGADPALPAHTAVMGYVVRVAPRFRSWGGHDVTRRNLLQFNGRGLDKNDIRYGQPGFRPLPDLTRRSDEEKEYLLQNLESLLHPPRNGVIVAQLKDFMDDQSAPCMI